MRVTKNWAKSDTVHRYCGYSPSLWVITPISSSIHYILSIFIRTGYFLVFPSIVGYYSYIIIYTRYIRKYLSIPTNARKYPRIPAFKKNRVYIRNKWWYISEVPRYLRLSLTITYKKVMVVSSVLSIFSFFSSCHLLFSILSILFSVRRYINEEEREKSTIT